jgi:hypothetical protein
MHWRGGMAAVTSQLAPAPAIKPPSPDLRVCAHVDAPVSRLGGHGRKNHVSVRIRNFAKRPNGQFLGI